MKFTYKILAFVLVFALLVLSLSACGPSAEDEAAVAEAQKAAEEAAAQLAEAEKALADAEAKASAAESAESLTEAEVEKAKAELEALQKELDAAKAAAAEAEAAATAMVNTEVDFLTWFQYDETNEDPASDERVGNEYLRKTIPIFNEAFEGQWNWVNRPKAWDKMAQELVAAVIAGNVVPDIIEVGSGSMTLYYRNGAVQDLSEWAKQQSWYETLDKGALASCTAPDGTLLCVPVATRPHLVYVWADRFPDGFPKTPEQFVTEAERLKAEGFFAWTYFGSTAFGGSGTSRMVWTLISSFGGTYDDGNGNMYLTSPETVAAIEFLRMTVQKGYNPETVFAGGFIEEDSFKDASAGAIPTGLFGYRYINPLTAPDSTKYDKGNEQDMLDAIAAGDVILAPMFAPEGKTPGCGTDIQGFSIPTGAKNVEAAYDFINWIMSPEQHSDFVLGPGAGFPANLATLNEKEFQIPFYQAAAKAVEQSVCTPWYGSLERREEAAEMIMNVIYKLIKEDPTADIVTELQKVEAEYNSGN
jgi:multiple sugar transport system substrate-binding protein